MAPREFTPALRWHVLTPFFDATVSALGFGQKFIVNAVDLLAILPGERVLDAGCGTGRLIPIMARRSPSFIHGIDIDRKALKIARERTHELPHVNLTQSSLDHVPLETSSIDAAISVLTFHHLDDATKRAALRELHRVLRSEGRLLIVDFGPPTTLLQRVVLTIASYADGRENVRANLAGELPTMAREAGFRVKELRSPVRGIRYLACRPTAAVSEHAL